MLITKRNLINEFKNKKILITGGTGTIGVGLANQLIKFKPRNIRILSNDENSIFEMKRDGITPGLLSMQPMLYSALSHRQPVSTCIAIVRILGKWEDVCCSISASAFFLSHL